MSRSFIKYTRAFELVRVLSTWENVSLAGPPAKGYALRFHSFPQMRGRISNVPSTPGGGDVDDSKAT